MSRPSPFPDPVFSFDIGREGDRLEMRRQQQRDRQAGRAQRAAWLDANPGAGQAASVTAKIAELDELIASEAEGITAAEIKFNAALVVARAQDGG